jgi:hypothetical protein
MRLTILKLALQLNIINVTLTLGYFYLNTNTITKLKNQRNKCSKCRPPFLLQIAIRVLTLLKISGVRDLQAGTSLFCKSSILSGVFNIFSCCLIHFFFNCPPEKEIQRSEVGAPWRPKIDGTSCYPFGFKGLTQILSNIFVVMDK